MGGINCPPHDGGDDVAIQMAYAEKLAIYSRLLFSGAAKFFEANVAIEEAVIQDGGLDGAIQLLSECESDLLDARDQLGGFAALWASISRSDVDFGRQMVQLTEAADQVAVARMELQALVVGGSLQQMIWRDPAVTRSFVTALSSLSRATQWQGNFATACAPAVPATS